jgi:hypothetical protein
MGQVQSLADHSGWPYRSWQFWCGLLTGIGIGLLLGPAFVETDLLTPHSKAWCSVLGIVLVSGGAIAAWRRSRRP